MVSTDAGSTVVAAAASRRLAAVVFTDVVGYAAMVQSDEANALARVHADLEAMVELAATRRGECINRMGDGLMLAFASAVEAVEFALEAQRRSVGRNAGAPEGHAVCHRIGIHLGDVLQMPDGALAGDGVNIAARLEPLAPAGGIAASEAVHDVVRGKLAFAATCAGATKLKNIDRPVTVWHLVPEGVTLGADLSHRVPSRRRRSFVVGAVAAAGVVTGAGLWWRQRTSPAGPGVDSGPDRLAIAVLPFQNLGEDKDTGYFAEGVHEDLLTQLASLGQLKVISRSSVMEYRKTDKKVPQIATELKVGSIVQGSVRRAGNTVRVSAQLLDAQADRHVWAASYDRNLRDNLQVQSEIAAEIAKALNVSLTTIEQRSLARGPTQDVEAYELYLRHQAMVRDSSGTQRMFTTLPDRIRLLEQAVARDPRFALAWAKLAGEHARAKAWRFDVPGDPRALARDAIERAVVLAPDDLQVLVERGVVQNGLDEFDGAITTLKQVLARAPNHVDALGHLSIAYFELTRFRDAAESLERALAVDGRDPANLVQLANIFGIFRHYERSIALRRRLLELRPEDIELRALVEKWQYRRSGELASYEAWRKTLGPGAESTSPTVHDLDTERAMLRRDFAEVHRLIDIDPEEWRRGQKHGREIAAALRQRQHVEAWLAEGRRELAMHGAREALSRSDAVLKVQPESRLTWETRAFMHATLGERAAAFAAFEKAIAFGDLAHGGGAYQQELTRRRRAFLHALLGERERALELLRRAFRLPGFHPVQARTEGLLASLWNDAAFQALLDDAANNAPLPLDTPVLVTP